jgi:hypothetical protein
LPEVSSRLSLNVKAKAASKLYLKCPELPGSTQGWYVQWCGTCGSSK